jgi:hypothetical protein
MNQEMGFEKRNGKGAHLPVKKVLVLVSGFLFTYLNFS